MHIQVNSPHVPVSPAFHTYIEERTSTYLERYAEWLTRVEIHLHDKSGSSPEQSGHCVLEARIRSMDPVVAEAVEADPKKAFGTALEKLRRALSNKLGRYAEGRHPH